MFYNGDCVIYSNSNRNKSLYGVVQPVMLPIRNSNICVFEVKIKVHEGKTICFQIKKYDNVFITFRNFCFCNNIPPYFYKPILIQIFLAMNRTFELFNSDVNRSNAMYLLYLKNTYYQNLYSKAKKKMIKKCKHNKSF